MQKLKEKDRHKFESEKLAHKISTQNVQKPAKTAKNVHTVQKYAKTLKTKQINAQKCAHIAFKPNKIS